MNLPKPNRINAEKYVAGLSLFNKKTAQVKLSANESALGPSPKAIREFIKVSKSLMSVINQIQLAPRQFLSFV